VFAFDDSSVGRELLKRTAKYGGYEDLDNNGKPYTDSTCGTASPNSKCSEWDKNGDGIPDTYFEAQQGQQLVTALSQAFNDILSRVSSGTAASILKIVRVASQLLQQCSTPKKPSMRALKQPGLESFRTCGTTLTPTLILPPSGWIPLPTTSLICWKIMLPSFTSTVQVVKRSFDF